MDEEIVLEYLKRRAGRENGRLEYQRDIDRIKECERHWHNEALRISYTLDNPKKILSDLAKEFEDCTSLNLKDLSFLFFATALQCCRWLLQPKITASFDKISSEDRHSSQSDGAVEYREGKIIAKEKESGTIKSRKYPDCSRMFVLPVPYDAMDGTERIIIPGVSEPGKRLYGGNHHSATMGHDPVLGYIFGTINILTRTITFKNPILQTCSVKLYRDTYVDPYSYRGQYVAEDVAMPLLLERLAETAKEDMKRIPAAIIRQTLHIQSDKYTKDGLPIPFVNPEMAQNFLKEGWNSYELERFSKYLLKNTVVIGLQSVLSMLINIVIEILHKLVYNPIQDGSKEIYEVKTRKILLYSNVIASSSNVIYSAISKDLAKLDIGGILVTIHRIVSDTRFIDKIKNEYIFGGYESQLRLRNFDE